MHQWRRQIAESSQNLNWLADSQLNILLGSKKGTKIDRVFGDVKNCFIDVPGNHSCLIMGYEINTPAYDDRFGCKLWGNATILDSSYVNLGYRKQYGLLIPDHVRISLSVEDNNEKTSCLINYILLDHRSIEMKKAQHTIINSSMPSM